MNRRWSVHNKVAEPYTWRYCPRVQHTTRLLVAFSYCNHAHDTVHNFPFLPAAEPGKTLPQKRACVNAPCNSPCVARKTHRGGLGLGGSVHEEAHPCFPCFIRPSFKSVDGGSIYHPLVRLIHLLITLCENKPEQPLRSTFCKLYILLVLTILLTVGNIIEI